MSCCPHEGVWFLKIAILMGNRFNPWHAGVFAPLADRFSFTAFVSSRNIYPVPARDFSTVVTPYEDETCGWLKARQLHLKYRLLHKRTGYELKLAPFYERLASFDIVHSWEIFTEWSGQAVEAKKRFKNRLLVTFWDTIPFHYEENPERRRIRSSVLENADAFVVYTEKSRAVLLLEGVSREKIFPVSPSVDLDRFRPQGEARGRRSVRTVLFVGRHVPGKGIRHLLFAWRLVAPGFPEATLRLLGSGSDRELHVRLAERLGVSNRVELVDDAPYERMPEVYAGADLFVLPSIPTPDWEEQFSMALVEAMACGVPAIASHSGAIAEILGSAGLLVPPADFPGLASALRFVMGNHEERVKMGFLGRQRAEERFDSGKNAKALDKVYTALR
jgi:starch synthase